VSTKLWHFFSKKLKLPLHFNLELSHATLFHKSPLSHVLPYILTLKLSSLHQVIFRHPYLTHMKSDFRNLECHGFSMSFPPHLLFEFHLKKKMLPSNSEKILWSNKFLKYSLVEFISYENQDGLCFSWDLRL
jgi:hypothetical protein